MILYCRLFESEWFPAGVAKFSTEFRKVISGKNSAKLCGKLSDPCGKPLFLIKMKTYNNPTCSKCVTTLELLNEKNIELEIINYLETPPTTDELKEIIQKLNISAFDLIRKKENIFQEKYADKNLTDDDWIKLMIKYPILIEQPIIINGNKAVIGRPPTKVLDIL